MYKRKSDELSIIIIKYVHKGKKTSLFLICFWNKPLFVKWHPLKQTKSKNRQHFSIPVFWDRQLCFYANFWFSSQNSHFWGISPFFRRFASCVTGPFEHVIWEVTNDTNLPKNREMPQKWLFWLKNQKFS